MRQIKILQIIQQGEIGGGESHLLTLISKLDTSKFEIVVVALSNGEMIPRLNAQGIKCYVIPSKLPFNFTIWREIRNVIVKENIDVIHTHGARSLSNVLFPKRGLNIPIVHTVHGWSFHDHLPLWKKIIRIYGEKYLTRRSTINIAVSESNRQRGLREFGNYNCIVINNGVDLSIYTGSNRPGIRNEFNIPQDATVICFVARFIHDKNPIALIKAFQRISSKFPGTYLLMIGDGSAKPEAERLVSKFGLTSRVIFGGYRNDVKDILSASDIFCLPSIKEGLPVSLIEAMAMNVAVIATNVEGCMDVISDNIDGLLVSLEDLETNLEFAISRLIAESASKDLLIQAARNTVLDRFDATKMAHKVEELYSSVVAKTLPAF